MLNHLNSVFSRLLNILLCACCVAAGCGTRELKPVDLYPDDACSSCRMAISDPTFAAEFILEDGTAVKFDDIGCLLSYRKQHPESAPAEAFVKDCETGVWLKRENSFILKTTVSTPMSSGLVAIGTQAGVDRVRARYPSAVHDTSFWRSFP